MIEITGGNLTVAQVVSVAHDREPVAPLSEAVRERMRASREWLAGMVESGEATVYGVNTGFGPLASTGVQAGDLHRLSRNLILNCCAGVGPPLSDELVRAMMVIRANTLAIGCSGVRSELGDTYIAMLNRGVTPEVPSKGSLGASGDLAPLAHIAVVMTRGGDIEPDGFSGYARYDSQRLTGAEAMERAGIPRLVPGPKEGLALTNGTTFMVAAGALGASAGRHLLSHAELAGALSFEALEGLTESLHPALHEAARQPGQAELAARLRTILAGSELANADPERVQDAYSVRCISQVLGPISDAIDFVHSRFESLLNGSSDNPLVFADKSHDGAWTTVSGGNFHGEGPALWLDFLGIAASEIASLSERRVFRLLTPELNAGLPSMLVPVPGLDSGLMVAQYTAAALVSDNKTLAHPDSVDSIPSSANQEDHVSMGANGARHALEILDNVRSVLAIELLCAAQAIDLREGGPGRLSPVTAAVHASIREAIPFLKHDRPLTPDIEAAAELIRSGDLLAAAEEAAGAKIWPQEAHPNG
ncbi:MAG: histidine ammonia-lyase [Gemmatimonadota bacterium]